MGDLATHPLSQRPSQLSGRGQGRNARLWLAASSKVALGRSRGSAGKMTGPRKVGQGVFK